MDGNKAIKYGTETTIEDKWKAFLFYKFNRDVEFDLQYQKNKKLDARYGTIKNDDENFKILKEAIKAQALELTLSEFGLPINIEEFGKLKEPELLNNGVINNRILDDRIALLTNSEILKEIAYTPSSTAKLKTVAVKIDELKKKNSKYNILDSNVSASDINGKFDANTKNSAGKAGIGVIANKLQVFNFLAKVGTQLTEGAFNYQIGGYTGTGYQYTNKKGERISDSLSTLLSVMTDNAKDPIAGQLNLSQEYYI